MPLTVRVDRDYDRVLGVGNEAHACFRISDADYAACNAIKEEFICVTRVMLYDEIDTYYPAKDVILKNIDGQSIMEIPKLSCNKD